MMLIKTRLWNNLPQVRFWNNLHQVRVWNNLHQVSFWNNLHQVRSKAKDWKTQQFKSVVCPLKAPPRKLFRSHNYDLVYLMYACKPFE